jgi:hypothetical protein
VTYLELTFTDKASFSYAISQEFNRGRRAHEITRLVNPKQASRPQLSLLNVIAASNKDKGQFADPCKY